MCGIIAVARRRCDREPPSLPEVEAAFAIAEAALEEAAEDSDQAGPLARAAHALDAADELLRGVPGVLALLADRAALSALERRSAAIAASLAAVEAHLDAEIAAERVADFEAVNAALVRIKDAAWAVSRDRLATARAVDDLMSGTNHLAADGDLPAVEAYLSIQVALAAIDRLEVRGRDSAGLQVFVTGHGLDLDDPAVASDARLADPLYGSGAIRAPRGHLAFVYKTAAEIGELGDNTARLRARIRGDQLLRRAVASPGARVVVLGHTRWASVGIISEANAHPLDSTEVDEATGPWVTAVLNGDVDNYADLIAAAGLRIPTEITTDAKVIPALVSRRMTAGADPGEAFRATVAGFEGSVAIAAHTAEEPERLLLAQRGSGQALYVGLAEDAFLVASEPYGLVAEATAYLRLDGESMLEPGNPATQGQIVVLDLTAAGSAAGIERRSYDGRVLPVEPDEWQSFSMTTRDVDRGDFPHYLLKEISESPAAFRKTLRGRIVERAGHLTVQLPDDALPPNLRGRLRRGEIGRVVIIGQGTAAVAGQSLATVLRRELGGRGVVVEAAAATELSGFGLADDMRDTLVVAISQSGTTTDTNRTVDVVRARGGCVISIVNRRQSDLVDKSDGVLYTSDGRDIEMSVASTKAFYAQIAAGFLLAFALADELAAETSAESPRVARRRSELLGALRELPDAMHEVLAERPAIAAVAQRHAPGRRYWAVVGNGMNRVAASEVRIKLSELCYKSIACDVTEDKKHIDLSAEPLVVVCAAGLHGSTADDVAKELAIYRAHKAAPIVIADAGDSRFGAVDTIDVPPVHPELAFVVAAMAGHLFGYEAALAIDATARPLREARGAIEAVISRGTDGDDLLCDLAEELEGPATRFWDGLRSGVYDGSLEAATAVKLGSLLRYATRLVPLDGYQIEFGNLGIPSTLIEDLTAALTAAIEQLTRPIDAIKHQAKTVTVGISRSDETLLRVPLVREVLATGCARDLLTYRALRTLVELDPAVDAVAGYTRYRIEGEPARGDATVAVTDKGGIARDIASRTADSPRLRGTKHRVAFEREVTVVKGRADGRTLVIVPEVKGGQTTGLTLLHVRFHDFLAADVARRVLQGYRDRYNAIADQVTETEPVMRDDLLAEIAVVDLLTEPVVRLADRWK